MISLCRGLRPHKENGRHLSTDVMNGIFSTDCDPKHGQTQLTVALWFKYTVRNKVVIGYLSRRIKLTVTGMSFNPLIAGAACIRVFIFIRPLNTTFSICYR